VFSSAWGNKLMYFVWTLQKH